MKRLLLFLLALLTICTSVLADDHKSLFTPQSDKPVISHASTDWESGYHYTDPGAVTYYGGQFHIFRNAFRNWPDAVQTDYLTSPDGIVWKEMSDQPVLTTKDVPFAKVAALASSVLVEDDGTWDLYFYTWNTLSGAQGRGEIGRATATNPIGPWTVDPDPVLTAGSAGSWDEQMVNAPEVLRTDNGYVMYYAGFDQSGNTSGKIGMATSADGIHWTKYDDPTTTDKPYAESDPILVPDADWEGVFLNQPRVEHTSDGWVMLYRASGKISSKDMKIGLATSADGVKWTKYAGNPVFSPTDISGIGSMWYTATTYHDRAYYLFTELSPNSGSAISDIFSMVYTGSLPPAN